MVKLLNHQPIKKWWPVGLPGQDLPKNLPLETFSSTFSVWKVNSEYGQGAGRVSVEKQRITEEKYGAVAQYIGEYNAGGWEIEKMEDLPFGKLT